jgi:hypothetical protein
MIEPSFFMDKSDEPQNEELKQLIFKVDELLLSAQ